jgi:DNA-directed RNA polymerase specialized sigma24 family protein
MLMPEPEPEPEPEPPKHLQRAEVDAALIRLVQDAGEMARARKLARLIAHGLAAMDAEDLLQKAMMLLLAERRRWPRGLSTLGMLKGVMRSIAYRSRRKLDYLLAEDLGAPTDVDSEVESSPLAEGVSLQSDLARAVQGESELVAVQNAVKGDEELEFLVEALAEGLTGMNIATELGWDAKKYDAARKRLSRRLAALKIDRS